MSLRSRQHDDDDDDDDDDDGTTSSSLDVTSLTIISSVVDLISPWDYSRPYVTQPREFLLASDEGPSVKLDPPPKVANAPANFSTVTQISHA